MPRKYLDYNRSWPDPVNYYPKVNSSASTAFEEEKLATAYLRYHEMVESLLKVGADSFGNEQTLLLDLHGFSNQPEYAPQPDGYDLILGTGNRGSILYGDVDIVMGEYLTERGYSVFVPGVEPLKGQQEDCFVGDFTTRYHSRNSEVNAIQVEIANRFRNGDDAKILGAKLARDLSDFVDYYKV
jgi:N-formylglutamate amidohydrolase